MAAVKNRKIAQQDILAILQADRLVAHARRLRALSAAQTLAPDAARSGDGDVRNAVAPNQAVLEMAVTEVLVHVPLIGLGVIESAGSVSRRIGRNDRCAVVQVQRDVALQSDGIGKIIDRK